MVQNAAHGTSPSTQPRSHCRPACRLRRRHVVLVRRLRAAWRSPRSSGQSVGNRARSSDRTRAWRAMSSRRSPIDTRSQCHGRRVTSTRRADCETDADDNLAAAGDNRRPNPPRYPAESTRHLSDRPISRRLGHRGGRPACSRCRNTVANRRPFRSAPRRRPSHRDRSESRTPNRIGRRATGRSMCRDECQTIRAEASRPSPLLVGRPVRHRIPASRLGHSNRAGWPDPS